ncbi:helix-turn-helix domain-containing protein [Lacisediminimonas profundi]|uniref:helix-turn-helix domain-containing protein n=1 Tax=Lacisediminimonas profundi TaxID=2603856 RepID=UPI00124B5C50|nr:AraC family transcriptional regulator [Lacisediminimonas profundi]
MSTAIRIFQGKFGRVALLDMDGPLVTHAHSQCHVLLKASGADTFFSVRDQLQPLADNTAVLVNSWEPHCYAHQNPDAPRTQILALYIEPIWLGAIESKLTSSAHPGFFRRPCVEISPHIRRLANELAMQMMCGEHFREEQLEVSLSNLMMSVIDAFSEWRSFDLVGATRPQLVQDRRIRRAITLMRDNMGGELNVDRLASEACLSRAHFFKLFQQCTAVTPHVYSNVLRMEDAISSLACSDDTLCSISQRLGFSAQSHFTRFFQQHLGIAPSQYRRVVDLYEAQQGRLDQSEIAAINRSRSLAELASPLKMTWPRSKA